MSRAKDGIGMRLNSRFGGKCANCSRVYLKGEVVFWYPKQKSTDGKAHVVCFSCEQKEIAMRTCSFCGRPGHYAPTCPDKRGTLYHPTPPPPSAPLPGTTPFDPGVPPADLGDLGLARPDALSEALAELDKEWDLLIRTIQDPAARLILFYGPPGTGKTTSANVIGNPETVYNITLTEETPSAELRGHFLPKGSEFVWHDGPAMRAFKSGARLVLNEIDKASGDALSFCHALLDDPGVSAITLPTGETVHPDDGFRVFATMNGVPEDLPFAVRDRFAVQFEVKRPHPDAIRSLPEDLQLAACNSITTEEDRSIGLRAWKTFAALRPTLGQEHAAKAVFGKRSGTVLTTIRVAKAKS